MQSRSVTSFARQLPAWSRYGLAAALVVLAVGVRVPMEPWLGPSVPYLLFFPSIILAAWFGGFGPGLVATAGSAAAAAYWLLPPRFSFIVHGELLPLVVFLIVGTLIARIAGGLVAAELQLEEARDRLVHQFKAIPVPTYSYRWNGGDFVLADYNDAAFELSKGTIAEFIGKTASEVNPDRPDLRDNLAVAFQDRTVLTRRVTYQQPGHPTPFHLVARYNFAPPDSVIVHVENVTEAHVAEQIRQQLGAIVESSDDAIVGMDLEGTVTSWNRGAEMIFGYPAADVLGQSIRLIIPREKWSEEEEVFARIRAGDRVDHFDTVRVHKDGHRLDMSLAFSPIKNADGVTVGASKVGRDITDRRRSEQMREEMLARARAARSEAVDARDRLAFLASTGELLTVSLDFEETLRQAAKLAVPRLGDYCNIILHDEALGLKHVAWAHVDPSKEAVVRDLAMRALPRLGPKTLAARVLEERKTVRWLRDEAEMARMSAGLPEELRKAGDLLGPYAYVGVPLRVAGRPVGVMSFATTLFESHRIYTDADVELIEEFARRASLAIENARLFARAEELNRLKDDFLATLSHELRTPLSAILGWARMLRQDQVAAEARARALESIERNAQAQTRIVEDILDVARGVTGNLRLEVAAIDLAEVARRAVDAVVPAAAAKQIAVDVRAHGPVIVDGDSTRLQQVIWNLLSNGVKFTPRGGRVTVEVERDESTGVLTVTDTGIGISREFMPLMFDKFRQQDQSFTRQFGGLGLGLSIVRQIVELHGGSIQASSDGQNRGARFTVHLPLAPAARGAGQAGTGVVFRGQ